MMQLRAIRLWYAISLIVASFAATLAHADFDSDAAVGKKLFFDQRLSADGTVSCASCHDPAHAFSDSRSVAIGIGGARGTRNAPSLLSAPFHKSFSWDGRRTELKAQVLDPLLNPAEHGFSSEEQVLDVVRASNNYPSEFRSNVSFDRIGTALAAFVETLGQGQLSRFDRYLAGDKSALTMEEAKGLQVFNQSAGCSSCHQTSGAVPRFTDDSYHSVAGTDKFMVTLKDSTRRSLSVSGAERTHLATADPTVAALGRFNVTGRAADIGKYRTPSLRNVAVTGPYMHDGAIPTLEEAVDREIYYRGLEQQRPLILGPLERRYLIAFLHALTSEDIERKQGHQ